MYWQEDEDDNDASTDNGEVVDLLFNIRCNSIPVDHGEALKNAITAKLSWLNNEPRAAIHQIHVAESSHGWQRPNDKDGVLLPSRRTKLILRIPEHRIDDCFCLVDQKIDIEGYVLDIGPFKTRALSKLTTIFARYIESDSSESEDAFIERMLQSLRNENINVKKMMCGLEVKHRLKDQCLSTRKLMLSGLSTQDSLRLQQQGMGKHMLMGIGIFLPHKGIDAVKPG